jgi:hypothetical protein
MKTVLKIFAVTVLLASSSLFRAGFASADDGPFSCSPDFYQVISGQLKLLDPVTGLYTNIGTQQDNYNGIGYDTLDNYIYGFKTSTAPDNIGADGDLVRIGNDGTLTDLGTVSGLPVQGYTNGATDLDGNLYVRSGSSTIYEINIASMTATAIPISGTIGGGTDSVFVDNNLYYLFNNQLSDVNLNNDTVTNTTVSGPTNWYTGTAFGAAWNDNAGDIYFSNNATGSIYQINNYTGSSPTATFVVAGTTTSNNDGASCTLAAQSTFAAPIVNASSYTTKYNTPLNETSNSLLSNDVGSSLSVTSNTNPAHGSVVVNSDGTFVYTPDNGFSGPDSFEYTVTDAFGRTATTTITIDVAAPPPSAAKIPDTGFGKPPPPQHWTLIEVSGLLAVSLLGLGIGIRKKSRTRSK